MTRPRPERDDHRGSAPPMSRLEQEAVAHVLRLSRAPEGRPVFCLHAGTGLAWPYLALRRPLGRTVSLVGLQSPWLSQGVGDQTLSHLASHYVRSVRLLQPEGPYRLLGWSFGGNLAIEMASQLQRAGAQVSMLAVLDSAPPEVQRALLALPQRDPLEELLLLLGCPVDDLPRPPTSRDFVSAATSPTGPLAGMPASVARDLPEIYRRHGDLVRQPSEAVFDGDMTFFSAERPPVLAPLRGDSWRPHVRGSITDVAVPAGHAELLAGASLGIVGDTVRRALASE